jgi:hypothetical protein
MVLPSARLSAYVRELGGPDGKLYVDKLHALAVGEHRDTKVRLQTIEVLLDRGWGRAVERLNVSGSVAALDRAKIARLTDAELALAAQLVEKPAADDILARWANCETQPRICATHARRKGRRTTGARP